ncbi:MAG: transposase [Acidobacteria bacterium]|nr:transposase [Acidobacteriota bacterium]
MKDYVRDALVRHKEVFVPLAHPPGDAQADFGEALVVIGGIEQKAHFLCMDLPHSDACFVVAFSAENTESFLEGHNRCRVGVRELGNSAGRRRKDLSIFLFPPARLNCWKPLHLKHWDPVEFRNFEREEPDAQAAASARNHPLESAAAR